MSDPNKQDLNPLRVDVGVSPDYPGVVSIFDLGDGRTVVMPLPPEKAILYAALLMQRAGEVLSGSVPVSAREESGASLTLDRSRSERLDS